MADKPVDLFIKSGLPYSKSYLVTLPSSRSWWTNTSDFEFIAQIRKKKTRSSDLLLDITQFISVTRIDANHFLFELKMTGQNTRLVTEDGFYDIIISDPGIADSRAYEIGFGKVKHSTIISAGVAGEA